MEQDRKHLYKIKKPVILYHIQQKKYTQNIYDSRCCGTENPKNAKILLIYFLHDPVPSLPLSLP